MLCWFFGRIFKWEINYLVRELEEVINHLCIYFKGSNGLDWWEEQDIFYVLKKADWVSKDIKNKENAIKNR